MNSLLYPRLAWQNIRKNAKFYLPYIAACTASAAGFYNIVAITMDDATKTMPGAATVILLLLVGAVIIGIFSTVFLFYTNSFLMKRRQKEIGLYHILGMERRHVARILCWECLFSGGFSVLAGLGAGVLLSKLMLLILFRVLFFRVHFGFHPSALTLGVTAALFIGIFALNLMANLIRIRRAKPIELLYGSSVGEREPRSKWPLALIGALAMGAGYAISLTTEAPADAVLNFIPAVVLVILGTYCLFTAGSIQILKALRKNKRYYYQARHFTAVSGMLYRMKQNAVGLANICILSTMVLVMISTTVCLYVGVEDALDVRYPYDISFSLPDGAQHTPGEIRAACASALDESELQLEAAADYTALSFAAVRSGSHFRAEDPGYTQLADLAILFIMTADEYRQITGAQISLGENELLAYASGDAGIAAEIRIGERDFTVAQWLDQSPLKFNAPGVAYERFLFVVADSDALAAIDQMQRAVYGAQASQIQWNYAFDLRGTDEQIADCWARIAQTLGGSIRGECRQQGKAEFYALYGGFLFLGIFLGTIFLVATALIIYYKQISEGYDDRERYRIMQKVGMSLSEVRASISAQVMMVFFLPLLVAFIHLAASFNLITKLMMILNLSNVGLFALCALVTIAVFALAYAAVYALTAKLYYKIVV